MRRLDSPCKFIILTTFARPSYFERAIRADVQAHLLKDGPIDQLAESVHRVMQGHREISPELIFGTIKDKNPLSAREREILSLSAQEKSSHEISSMLHLSYGTVRNYISESLNKLDARNRIEAIRLAEEKGWL